MTEALPFFYCITSNLETTPLKCCTISSARLSNAILKEMYCNIISEYRNHAYKLQKHMLPLCLSL